MILQYIRIEHFGAVTGFEKHLTPGINLLCTRQIPELVAALEILLCRSPATAAPTPWLRQNTRFTARVCLEEGVFSVTAVVIKGRLQLIAPEAYRYALTHSPEQDGLEYFDGADRTLPQRLCRYRSQPPSPAAKTVHAHLRHYIQSFRPQPINRSKSYQISLDPEGNFIPVVPGCPDQPYLSETEERLFHYLCFLNLAEFWADLETLRDLHHEKKPLIVCHFLEYLDEETDLQPVLSRTQSLSRQVLLLTPVDLSGQI